MTKRTGGRPVTGRDEAGNPIPSSSYPRVNVHVSPRVRRLMDTLSMLKGVSIASVIETSLDAYVATLGPQQRKAIEEMEAARAESGAARVAVRKGKR